MGSLLLHCSPLDANPPGLASCEERLRVDVVAPPDYVTLWSGGSAADDREARALFGLVNTGGELVASTLRLIRSWPLGISLTH